MARPAHRSSRHRQPVTLAAAAFVLAGGYVHLREWLDGYRDVPADAPGAFVVRIGFPVNAALSVVVAGALVVTLFVATRHASKVVAAAALFQAGSLAVLIGTRVGSVLGWMEPTWTPGANQSRALEIGALLALGATLAVGGVVRRLPQPARVLAQHPVHG